MTPPRDYPDDDDRAGDGQRARVSRINQIADNPYLKLAERALVGLLALLALQAWFVVRDAPVTERRIQELETFAREMRIRADSARAERNMQMQTINVTLERLETKIEIIASNQGKMDDKLDRMPARNGMRAP